MEHDDNKIRQQAGRKNAEDLFHVPEHYFDEVSGHVKEKIAARSSAKPHYTMHWLLRPVFAVPALVVIIAFGVYFSWPGGNGKDTLPDTVAVSEDKGLEKMLLYETKDVEDLDIDPATLAEIVDESDLATTAGLKDSNNAHVNINAATPTREEMEEFVIENVDEQILINEL